jgi:hypothetical protein
MNRQGHVGTILLVIGAFILMVFALYTMISNNTDLTKIKTELRNPTDQANVNHEFILKNAYNIINQSAFESKNALDFEKSFNELVRKYAFDLRESGLNTNLYAKLSLGNYSLTSNESNYEILISDVKENYNLGNNEIMRSYSLKVIFDKDGIVSLEEYL